MDFTFENQSLEVDSASTVLTIPINAEISSPIIDELKKVTFWQPVIDKIQGKLEKWKRYNLSRGGRATLCKYFISHLTTYYMSVFLMPEKVIQEVKHIMRNFLWEGHKG